MCRLLRALLVCGGFAALGGARSALAQDVTKEGAAFLVMPVGARAVGVGQSVVASEIGGTGIWWNPASIARIRRPELTLDYSQTSLGVQGIAIAGVYPAGLVGVVAVGAYLLDLGEQEATDLYGTIGTILPRDLVLGASYAATIGRRVSVGVTYKLVQQRTDCTGSCGNLPLYVASTNGVDAGLQVAVDSARRLVLGAALRNVGFNLQVNDVPQADPLPLRLHLGARYLVPWVERRVQGATLATVAEVMTHPADGKVQVRAGGEFALQNKYYLRAGYAMGSGELSGASVGLGIRRAGLAMDFAQSFGDGTTDRQRSPTYLTLRFGF